jgi:hypothetical protein
MWTPKAILGRWAQWEVPAVTTGPVLPLSNESIVNLMACSQPQSAFESQALDNVYWDEQGVEDKWDAMNARMKTRRRFKMFPDGNERLTRGAHVSALTPHKLKDRPDTGANTWLHQMAEGKLSKGVSCAFYHGDIIKDVPDWIYSERQKLTDLEEIRLFEERNDRKRLRQIRARIYGEWEVSGGLVYDEWDPAIHVIDDFKIPPNFCMVRTGDHGRVNPCSWLWIAISPDNTWFLVREYEGLGLTIAQNVERIVKLSGNSLRDVGSRDFGHQIIRRREEQYDSERYLHEIMDGRSFLKPTDNAPITMGEMYQLAGMKRLDKSPIDHLGDSKGIELVRMMLCIDPEREHWTTKRKGAPRLYVFRSCRRFVEHIERYRNKASRNDEGNPSEKPQDFDDHDLDALRYAASLAPRYNANFVVRPNEKEGIDFENRRKYWCAEDVRAARRGNGKRRSRRFDRFTGREL